MRFAQTMKTNNFMLNDISKRIKFFRKKKGFSQERMANKLGINQNSYARIENNVTKLDLERLFKIAKILEIDVYLLLTGEAVPKFNFIDSETYIDNLIGLIKMLEEDIKHLKRKLEC